MNKELRAMMETAFIILGVLLVVVNSVAFLNSNNYITAATKSSQQIALNRLRHANLNHSSEFGKYPQLKRYQKVKLLAVSSSNRLYVISNHRVLYIINATINTKPTTTTINAARGERAFHVNKKAQIITENWLNFDRLGYIEALFSVDNKRVHGNWLANRQRLTDTIEVSRPDAKWLQQLPKGTKLIVKSGIKE